MPTFERFAEVIADLEDAGDEATAKQVREFMVSEGHKKPTAAQVNAARKRNERDRSDHGFDTATKKPLKA